MTKNISDRKLKMMMRRWGKIFITFEINHAKRMATYAGKRYLVPKNEIAMIRKIFC